VPQNKVEIRLKSSRIGLPKGSEPCFTFENRPFLSYGLVDEWIHRCKLMGFRSADIVWFGDFFTGKSSATLIFRHTGVDNLLPVLLGLVSITIS
jgi:hypothetical protein